jgi:hypothetical protein
VYVTFEWKYLHNGLDAALQRRLSEDAASVQLNFDSISTLLSCVDANFLRLCKCEQFRKSTLLLSSTFWILSPGVSILDERLFLCLKTA